MAVSKTALTQSKAESELNTAEIVEQFRLLLRHELSLLNNKPLESVDNNPSDRVVITEIPSTTTEIAEVDDTIEYFISTGEISESDMNKLQTEIVKLDTKSRREMFKKLVQAMNSGMTIGVYT